MTVDQGRAKTHGAVSKGVARVHHLTPEAGHHWPICIPHYFVVSIFSSVFFVYSTHQVDPSIPHQIQGRKRMSFHYDAAKVVVRGTSIGYSNE